MNTVIVILVLVSQGSKVDGVTSQEVPSVEVCEELGKQWVAANTNLPWYKNKYQCLVTEK